MKDDFPIDLDALLTVLDQLNLGVYVTDRERRIRLWNRKAAEITGYRAEDVLGKACHEQVLNHVDRHGHQLCRTTLCPLYRAMILGRESAEPEIIYAMRPDGQRVAVSVSAAPLRDAEGRVIGGIETFRDETAQVRDMEFARKIQRHLMPAKPPAARGFRFDFGYYPHDLVGGDFYDIIDLAEDRFGILVADVRGHGVSAALYMMWMKSLETSLRADADEPARFLAALNEELTRYVVDESFATCFYGVLDAAGRTLTYASAGHPAPMHFRGADGNVAELRACGMPLGIRTGEDYGSDSVTLAPGDVLLLYTDGAIEVSSRSGELLRPGGLARMLAGEAARSREDLPERLYGRIMEWCGEVALPDDLLLFSISAVDENG